MQAFERELLTLLPRLRRFARALARDAADADDLLQVSLERALRARHQWTPGTRLDAWMMRIVRNCWIDETRGGAPSRADILPEEEGASVGTDSHREIEAPVEAARGRQANERAVGRAARGDRARPGRGPRLSRAGGPAQIPDRTLTSRLTRGRQALAQMLELEAA